MRVDVEIRKFTCFLNSGVREIEGKATRIGVGQYSLDFVPTAEGTYNLDVRTEEKQIFKVLFNLLNDHLLFNYF